MYFSSLTFLPLYYLAIEITAKNQRLLDSKLESSSILYYGTCLIIEFTFFFHDKLQWMKKQTFLVILSKSAVSIVRKTEVSIM